MSDYTTFARRQVADADLFAVPAFLASIGNPVAVLADGFLYVNVDQATLDAAIAAFNFNAANVAQAKIIKIAALKTEAVRKAGLLYAFINDASICDFANDLFLSARASVVVAAQGPVSL